MHYTVVWILINYRILGSLTIVPGLFNYLFPTGRVTTIGTPMVSLVSRAGSRSNVTSYVVAM